MQFQVIQLKIDAEKQKEDDIISKLLGQKSVFDPVTFKRTGKAKKDLNNIPKRPRRLSLDSLNQPSLLGKDTFNFDIEQEQENLANEEPKERVNEMFEPLLGRKVTTKTE